MAMLNFINRLQRESEDNRRRIALFVALVITLVIFSVWLWYFLTTTLDPESSNLAAATSTEVTAASPFETLSRAFNDLAEAVTGAFQSVRYESAP